MSVEPIRLLVPSGSDETRLDHFLTQRIPGQSRSTLGRWIRAGLVTVDDRPATKLGQSLHAGTRIVVVPPEPAPGRLAPEAIPIDVEYEDDEILVAIKPAGMVVHPGAGCPDGTLVNALMGRGTTLAPVGGTDRPGIVHRLDRGTSGLIVVAKTDRAHRELCRAFERREVKKRYVALVWGHPDPSDGKIGRPIGRSRANPVKMAVQGTRGRNREARTTYRTVETLTGFSLLDVEPHTGRTHQIRVHLQSIHHPIVGDDRYGGRPWRGVQDPLKRKALKEFDRLALHAAELGFTHPGTGERLGFRAPLSRQFEELLRVLRDGSRP